MTSSLATGGE